MPNPFAMLNPQPNPMGDMRSMYQAFANSRNPMELFSRVAMQNPNLQPIMQMLRGQDPQAVFNTLCRQRGIDPTAFMRNLTGNNG